MNILLMTQISFIASSLMPYKNSQKFSSICFRVVIIFDMSFHRGGQLLMILDFQYSSEKEQ